MSDSGWSDLANFASGIEAEIAIAQLRAAGIPAMRNNNDHVGIFGPGFEGPTSRGYTVRVPTTDLEEAREAVGPSDNGPA